MRKTKEIEIQGRTITAGEIRVRTIWEKYQVLVSGESGALQDTLDAVLEECAGLKPADLLDWYPSEIEELYRTIEEVNQSFFDGLRRVGVSELVSAIKLDFLRTFAGSFGPDTSGSGITA